MSDQLKTALGALISEKYAAGEAVDHEDSLFYSGMIDSLGIAEIATFLSKESGRTLDATEIVENDLDTINLLVEWAAGA